VTGAAGVDGDEDEDEDGARSRVGTRLVELRQVGLDQQMQ